MRLICTCAEEGKYQPLAFAYFLENKGIDNRVEVVEPLTSHVISYNIWVIEEDQVDEAQRLYDEYKKDPQNARYKPIAPILPQKDASSTYNNRAKKHSIFPKKGAFPPISTLILSITILFFIWTQFQHGNVIAPRIKGVVEAPLMAPIERLLLYDYPEYFEIRDKLFTQWPPKAIEKKEAPSAAALMTLQELQKKEVWMGMYQRIFLHKENPAIPLQYKGPIFEKISHGQFWRALTPAFLHYDILHIFFNLLWLVILSHQIENRIGSFRMLLFVLITAIFSNTAQYLVTGPFFMGLSGIICAMAAFIWARQQKAPWEGYLIHRMTLIFLGIFVIGMFSLSTLFFLLQFYQKMEISMPIANTAHLSGALIGYLLGRTSLFASHL